MRDLHDCVSTFAPRHWRFRCTMRFFLEFRCLLNSTSEYRGWNAVTPESSCWRGLKRGTFCGSCVTCSRAKHHCTQGCSCGVHPHAIIAFGTSLVAGFNQQVAVDVVSCTLFVHTVKGSALNLPRSIVLSPLQVEDDDRPSTWGNMLKRQYYEKFGDTQGKSDSRWSCDIYSTHYHEAPGFAKVVK